VDCVLTSVPPESSAQGVRWTVVTMDYSARKPEGAGVAIAIVDLDGDPMRWRPGSLLHRAERRLHESPPATPSLNESQAKQHHEQLRESAPRHSAALAFGLGVKPRARRGATPRHTGRALGTQCLSSASRPSQAQSRHLNQQTSASSASTQLGSAALLCVCCGNDDDRLEATPATSTTPIYPGPATTPIGRHSSPSVYLQASVAFNGGRAR
jgi:hypothetical protein